MRFSSLSCRMEECAPQGASEKVRSPSTTHSQTVPGGSAFWGCVDIHCHCGKHKRSAIGNVLHVDGS
jgi:hypothetical protein